MHTLPTLSTSMDPQIANQAMLHAPLAPAERLPFPGILPGTAEQKAPAQSAAPDTFSELDEMLIRDPNVGAIHGLRTALLFNAGLALSGLVIWEIWAMLAL